MTIRNKMAGAANPPSLPQQDICSMADLITAYRCETDAMDDISVSRTDEEDKCIEAAREIYFAALRDNPPRILSFAEVISAIELARDDVISDGIGGFVPNLLNAVLDYFRGSAERDAMLALVNEYHARLEAYSNAPMDIPRETEARLGEELSVQSLKLINETPNVTSMAGAVAAVELARQEAIEDGCGGFGPNILKAALDYLKSASAEVTAPDPVFQAIDEFLDAHQAFNACSPEEDKACGAKYHEKLETLADTLPTTIEGRRRQLAVLREAEEGCLVDDGSMFVKAMLNIVNDQLGMRFTLPE